MTPNGPPWPTRGDPRATSDPPIAVTPWPRRRPPAPRINRKTDETYHRVRAELEARELARRERDRTARAGRVAGDEVKS